MKVRDLEILKTTLEIVFVVGTLTHAAKTQGPPSLLCAHRRDIRKLNLENNEYSVMFSNLSLSLDIDYHYADNIVVWTDIADEKIYSASMMPNSTITTLVDDCVTPEGVAVDWIHRNVYWTDTGKDIIGVTQLNGGFATTLFSNNLDDPRAIVLNPSEGWMFWIDCGMEAKIERAGMDGTHRSVIVSSSIKWPNALAIDLQSRKIYWADSETHFVSSADYDGSNQRILINNDVIINHPFGLDEHENFLYWTVWRRSRNFRAIFRANKNGTKITKVVGGENWSDVKGIRVHHISKQPDGPNRCGEDNGGCSSLCLPAPDLPEDEVSHYIVPAKCTCACPTGMYLLDDEETCSSDALSLNVTKPTNSGRSNVTVSSTVVGSKGDPPFLLCANEHDIRKVDPETGEYTTVLRNLKTPRVIAYDYAKNTIVWTDTRGRFDIIYKAPLETDAPITTIIDGFSHLENVAVDWIHDKLYWSDSQWDAIGVVTFDGSSLKTLFKDNFDEPRPLALNPFEGWMFWVVEGVNARIERAGMDGTYRSVIVSRLTEPAGLAIDFLSRRIYWIDEVTHIIASVTYDGSDKQIIVSPDVVLPYSLDVVGEWAYWAEWAYKPEWESGIGSVYRINMSSGVKVAQRVFGGHDWKDLMSIRIFHQSKQPPGPNRCGSNNGGCSDLCLPAPDLSEESPKYTCACPDGHSLSVDGLNCSKGVPTLLYANTEDIRNVDLVTKKDVIIVSDLHRADFIDYHFEKDILVWTDSKDGKIYSAPLKTGMPITTLVDNCRFPWSVAVDWIHDKIYWADMRKKTIGVAMLNGSFEKTLLKDNVDSPRDIVINPLNGWMFWTDTGSTSRIERCGMDGSYRRAIVTEGAKVTYCLTIDFTSQKIYWADYTTRALSSVDYDGTNKRVIWESEVALQFPFSLDVFEGSFFWTKWTSGEEAIYKLSGQNLTKMVGGRNTVGGIKIYHKSKQPPGPNRCGDNNGGCSHLCLPSPDMPEGTTGFSCACPDGLFLSQDGSSCSTVESKKQPYHSTTILLINTTTESNYHPIGTTPESEVQWSFANESQEHSEESPTEEATGESGPKTGVIAIAVLIGLSLIALITFYVYRRYSRRTVPDQNFANPVYCKTTEDEIILPS